MTPRKFTLSPGLCVCRKPNCAVPFGLCHCGCGEKTNIACKTSHGIGWVEGLPIRYIRGHANRQLRVDFSKAEPFYIEGVACQFISLTRGLFAIIDAADYKWLSQWHWYALKAKDVFYAVRHSPTKKKVTGKHIYLHRFILGLGFGDPLLGDHINGNTLDNRRKNLRPVTEEQNRWNHKLNKQNSTGRDGVSRCLDRGNFSVQMRINGKMTNLGRYDDFKEACEVREAAEKKYRSGFTRASQ